MNSYLMPITCPRCGEPLEHVTASMTAGTETSAISRCSGCRRGWQVIVHLRPVTDTASRDRAALRAKAGA